MNYVIVYRRTEGLDKCIVPLSYSSFRRSFGRVDIFNHCEPALYLKANIWAISSDTYQLHYIPLHHFII